MNSGWPERESAGEEASSGSRNPYRAADPELELNQLRKERAEIMDLLGCKSPDRLIHDLRNLLNELNLLRLLGQKD
jgi:hypothetical protein